MQLDVVFIFSPAAGGARIAFGKGREVRASVGALFSYPTIDFHGFSLLKKKTSHA